MFFLFKKAIAAVFFEKTLFDSAHGQITGWLFQKQRIAMPSMQQDIQSSG